MPKTLFTKHLTRLVRLADYLSRHPEISLAQLEATVLKRRDFLRKSLLASASLVPMAGLLEACARAPVRKTSEPVAILGGGIAGLTAAYYLTEAGVPCEIYEATGRLGGRMFTATHFNPDGMHCELGGEFVDSNHADLIELCHAFGIALDDFAAGDRGLEQEMYYFGGKYHTDRELIPLFQPFARRLAEDQKKAIPTPDAWGDHFTDDAKRLDRISLEAYLDSFHDVEKWVLDVLRVGWVGEIGLEANEQSALLMVSTLSPDTSSGFKLFGDSDQSKCIRGGNIALIDAMTAYLKRKSVPVLLDHPLVAIMERSGELYLDFRGAGRGRRIRGSRVICTLPFSTLRKVEGIHHLPLDPLKKECISKLGYGTNAKFALGFSERIWRTGSLKHGSFRIPASNGMVYTDLKAQNIWESSRTQPGKNGILSCFLGGKDGAKISGADLKTFLGNTNEVFPGAKETFDRRSIYWNWTQYPFSRGSYSAPLIGQTTQFKNVAFQPELGGKLLFAGEHATDEFSGYMDGACHSGKAAALKILEELGRARASTPSLSVA